MSVRRGLVAATLALSACTAPGPPALSSTALLLGRADQQMATAEYRAAVALYDEFLQTTPSDPAAARVRATRDALERLVESQNEVERLRRERTTVRVEVERQKSDLSRQKSDLDRQKTELDRLRAEVARLRADLERLRILDLRQPAPR